ncbi:MAG: methyltransferase domain-containing protein [Chloroflexi bacterium]|nr:methyltransferase domain-containing protein [Chloroflexota bacterium]
MATLDTDDRAGHDGPLGSGRVGARRPLAPVGRGHSVHASESSRWSEWLAEQAVQVGHQLERTRDAVLAHAAVRAGDTVLDLGAGTGLVALAAADRVGPRGRVIGSDLDADCLRVLVAQAGRSQLPNRVRVVQADAAALPLADSCIDVVAARSVLAFIADRRTAMREAFRVLRPGGRISCFEPINRYLTRHHTLVDLAPLGSLGEAISACFDAIYADPDEPLLTFDERDLVHLLEDAGLVEVGLNLIVTWHRFRLSEEEARQWLTQRGSPGRPSVTELVASRLGRSAAERYARYFVEAASRQTTSLRRGSAFVWGRKPPV